ncbi:hypothetical protein [Vibrio parahaemolyticus]|uniref:hypothetical protein n=1 Tax=Vibrio parahaemolyticus TaxID=670 RepID=UPI0015E02B07|nr:hypothetical protein [Vibrio parahaemolyticus]EJC6931189.1 hypothetical protein [Vibrio parahaemolyticus]MBE4040030.1 hypothetical protein [Vibrio parahaemolyticus]
MKDKKEHQELALMRLREAIQEAEVFGLVRTESGQVITGAVITDDGVVLVEE